MTKTHEEKRKELDKKQDEWFAERGMEWNGEYWVRVRDGGRNIGE